MAFGFLVDWFVSVVQRPHLAGPDFSSLPHPHLTYGLTIGGCLTSVSWMKKPTETQNDLRLFKLLDHIPGADFRFTISREN